MTTLEILLTIICCLLGVIILCCFPKFLLWLTILYDDFFGEDNKKAKKRDIDNLKHSIDNLEHKIHYLDIKLGSILYNKDNNNE